MQYRGYAAIVDLDADGGLFHGELVGTRDVVTFQAPAVGEMNTAFEDGVDDYIEFCTARGELPQPPQKSS
jgi:predicted HicB family RNase H-like nuclease